MAKKLTQVEVIKRHLQSGKTITSLQAFKKWGITRLSAIIWTLRNEHGLFVRDETVVVQSRWQPTSVARYSL
ncbi:hypothetical protein DRH27_04450 [Candidatus Falkowbacteria bacterium]|nr:MAG: hypothetical protein DRH27_04450 [Candidatus Falkowbacteria bacterium]